MQPTPVFLPGESHGQRSLVGYSPWGCKESDTTEATSYKSFICSIILSTLCISIFLILFFLIIYLFGCTGSL